MEKSIGSRARGDHQQYSDADVAVFLRGKRCQRRLPIKLDMAKTAFDVMLDTDIRISPYPIWMDEWEHPETHPNPMLLNKIAHEGIPL